MCTRHHLEQFGACLSTRRSFTFYGNMLQGTIPSLLTSVPDGLRSNCYTESLYAPHNAACNVTAAERAALADLFQFAGGASWSGSVVGWTADPDVSFSEIERVVELNVRCDSCRVYVRPLCAIV